MKSIAMDIIQATFYFTFYTCFFITRAVYKDVENGKISAVNRNSKFFKKYPPGAFYGSITLGIIITILLSPLVIGAMVLINLESFTLEEFIKFKSIWGATMAAIYAPIFALIALTESIKLKKT